MKWDKPNIDYKTHISYSRRAQRVITNRLIDKYGYSEACRLWNKTKHIYEEYLIDLPYIGGKKNPMADQLYDSLICFAYWEAIPDKESVDEFKMTVDKTFFGQNIPTFPKWFSGENQKLINIIALAAKPLINLSINRHVCKGEWNNAWRVIVNPKKKPKEGMRAVLVGCPIVDFARKHNLMHLMPAMCNGDYGSMPYLRLDTIRPKTVAKGDKICDNYILNINSSMYEKYPIKTDDKGFLYNDEPVELKG